MAIDWIETAKVVGVFLAGAVVATVAVLANLTKIEEWWRSRKASKRAEVERDAKKKDEDRLFIAEKSPAEMEMKTKDLGAHWPAYAENAFGGKWVEWTARVDEVSFRQTMDDFKNDRVPRNAKGGFRVFFKFPDAERSWASAFAAVLFEPPQEAHAYLLKPGHLVRFQARIEVTNYSDTFRFRDGRILEYVEAPKMEPAKKAEEK